VTGRERGLRRAAIVTAVVAAGGIVGSGAVALIAHADTAAGTTATTHTTTNGSSTSTSTGTSGNGAVTDGGDSVPQAQSGGS
jgi:hypothetical protein